MKIGICTGGGDCPGLNSIIRAAVRRAAQVEGMELWGIKDSFNGLMSTPYEIWKLDEESVSGILMRGGTILGTTNAGNPFSLKNPSGGPPQDKSQQVIKAYKDFGFDGIIVIGGDGTQGIAFELAKLGMNIVGVPKTIDNDLASTDQTVGFDTALEVASEAIARLQTTAESHERVMILEVMGRNAGHIALQSGIASGAHVILLPEMPFDYDSIINKIQERRARKRPYSVIVVAEGAYPKGSEEVFKTDGETKNLGGIGNIVAQELFKRTKIDTRVTVLGHIQRGGEPSHVDRILGTAYGVKAVDLVHKKKFGYIVALQGGKLTEIKYEQVAGKFRPVPADDIYLQAAEGVGICLGQ